MKHLIGIFAGLCFLQAVYGQDMSTSKIDSLLPVRGLAISAPSSQRVDDFLKFVEEELVPAHFNMLILQIDWNYEYECHPELRTLRPLTKADIKKIVAFCKKYNITLAPQVNLLGHQSWGATPNTLLREYPQFDEAPNDTIVPYCKSYCPLHPDIHEIIFAAIDEIMDVFEAEYFHAGMDEVFYIGEDQCPRCRGRDKAELFAGEVTRIYNHLALKNRKMMIWGDRLLDGKTTGIGMWEASMNNTYRAIDMIPKEVFICDWHYERPELTSVYFAMKGFNVATCPWYLPDATAIQLKNMVAFRQQSTPMMKRHFQGMIQTVWRNVDVFLKYYYDPETYKIKEGTRQELIKTGDARSLKRMIEECKKLNE